MAKDARIVRDPHQKEIVKLFSAFDGSKNRRKIFDDFLIMLSNLGDPVHAEEREKLYLQYAGQYRKDELDIFARMIAEIVRGLEDNPDQDFLGEMYMALEFGSSHTGQFFTPYSVCRCMASVSADYGRLSAEIEKRGFVSVTDPACGAGALLMAFANECRRQNINPQTQVLFVAQDIDMTVGCMCYIAMSLMGLAGYVVIGDTLCDPNTCYDRRGLLPKDDNGRVWYTPMFMTRECWAGRRMAAGLDLMLAYERKEQPIAAQKMPLQRTLLKEAPHPPVSISPEPDVQKQAENEPYLETNAGQLMFF